ncbi:PDZ domain-containing protein 9 [Phalacrocorax aristotelis]|uniref:PDZ domain-containing protein 9 n=1 Tax=Phalacrocorax aristotelis TaxID=126867 RepID=UPI003F4BA1D3
MAKMSAAKKRHPEMMSSTTGLYGTYGEAKRAIVCAVYFCLPAEGNMSDHTLIASLKANIRIGEQGLGLIVIRNGPYLQITSLVELCS